MVYRLRNLRLRLRDRIPMTGNGFLLFCFLKFSWRVLSSVFLSLVFSGFFYLDYVGKVSYIISWCWAVYDVCCITNVY